MKAICFLLVVFSYLSLAYGATASNQDDLTCEITSFKDGLFSSRGIQWLNQGEKFNLKLSKFADQEDQQKEKADLSFITAQNGCREGWNPEGGVLIERVHAVELVRNIDKREASSFESTNQFHGSSMQLQDAIGQFTGKMYLDGVVGVFSKKECKLSTKSAHITFKCEPRTAKK